MTRLINISHIQKYCNGRSLVTALSQKIQYKNIPKLIKNGRGIVRSVSLRHFDLQEAIKISEAFYDKTITYKKEWKDRVEALRKVEQDFIKYGDTIPNTSDVKEISEKHYPMSEAQKKKRDDKIDAIKDRKKKVIKDFNKYWEVA